MLSFSFIKNIYVFILSVVWLLLVLPNGSGECTIRAKSFSVFILALFVVWITNRVYRVFDNIRNYGELTDEFFLCIYKLLSPLMFFILVNYWSIRLDIDNSAAVLVTGGFTPTTFKEVLLLVVLLFLALISYKRCLYDAELGTSAFIRATVKSAGWVFSAYALCLVWPIVSYATVECVLGALCSPLVFAESFKTVHVFYVAGVAPYLIVIKLLFVLVANYQLHLVTKYYTKFFISHNYFVIIMILLWGNLFALGIDHIGITFMVFDIISMCTAALIVLHEKRNENILTIRALFYFVLSIFTSLGAYTGLFYLYSQYHAVNFSFYYLYLENGGIAQPNGYPAIAWFFIFAKIAFLLGGFPFYKMAIEVGSSFYFPSVYYWSVVSKIPAALLTIKFFCIASLVDSSFFKHILICTLVASIGYASFAFYSTPRLKVFFAYSSMVNVPYILLFTAADWKASALVVPINFAVYAVAMFGILLFMSSSHKLAAYANVRGGNEIDTFESFLWTSQEIRFSKDVYNSPYSKDLLTAIVKVPTAVCALVLMGAAPFAGFLIKFLLVSLFASSSSFFICFVILLSSAVTHLAYFNLFSSVTEKTCSYTGRSNNEWVLHFDEDDIGYFKFIFIFNLIAIFFLMILMFLR